MVNYNRHNNNKEFFYGSSKNIFWDILSYVTKIKVNSEKNYFEILASLNIGITDIIKSTCRNNNGSADMDLYNIEYNDFLQLKNDYFPNLKNIYFTSGGKGKIKATYNNVASWFADYFFNHTNSNFNLNEVNDNEISYLSNNNDIYTQYGFEKKIKDLNLISLISPSPQANISIQGILNKNNNFNEPTLNTSSFRMLQWIYFIKKYNFLNDNKIPERFSNIYNKYFENNQSLLNFFDE